MAQKKTDRLDDYLLLNSFMNRLFGMESFDDFKKLLSNVEEGFDAEGRSYVFLTLHSQHGIDPGLRSKLEEYDANIKCCMDRINLKRDTPIRLKYFQYLAVLFTEIFLDFYFQNPVQLMNKLEKFRIDEKKIENFDPIIPRDLKKLALWMATGSGKTFLVHINYLQFTHYNRGPHQIELDNILLITSSESMSAQHLNEMQQSAIPCELFQSRNLGYWSGHTGQDIIRVIDIHKLTEEKKGQGVTVDIESFGRKNLIFVDEGHKGSGGKKWNYFREELAKEGFAFEYSATFGQAAAAANGKDQLKLLEKYGKSILFDYSYRYFYNDGYGKDYSILNLKDKEYSEQVKLRLMLANLLTLYEQKLVFDNHSDEIKPYNIEAPLWIFVGSKVQGTQNQSDIIEVVKFLDLVLTNRDNWTVKNTGQILAGNSGLIDKHDRDLFLPTYPEQRLGYLRNHSSSPEKIFKDLLKHIFHSDSAAPLHLLNIKNAQGEIGLKCGSGEFFGVINIGDDAQFLKLADSDGIITGKDEMSGSLFNNINHKNSKINVLIGAKKFIEGWSSWRVSNMGLLNIGKSEGTQIIQLFGRGVRLKGMNNSLKRSIANEEHVPEHLPVLEKLNIFGIKANYMDQFRDYLETEGMPTDNYLEVPVRIKINQSYLEEGLLVPHVDKTRFRREDFFGITSEKKVAPVLIDLMPKVEVIESQGNQGIGAQSKMKEKAIDHKYLDMLDWSRIYFSLLDFKVAKSWNNMTFTKEVLRQIIEKDEEAYSLKCPDDYITPAKFEDLWRLEEIVVSILKKYLQNIHNRHRNIWTQKNIDVKQLDEHSGNFEFKEFKVTLNEIDTDLIKAIEMLKKRLKDENFYGEDHDPQLRHVYFDRHLYQPLLVEDEGVSPRYKISPDSLNRGEMDFINNLKEYVKQNSSKFTEKRKMFVLRNIPKKGIGFFIETVNYYPDFIIWIKTDNEQKILFADPKGLVNMFGGFEDEKIKFHNRIKDFETEISYKLSNRKENQKVVLESWIISETPLRELQQNFGTGSIETFAQHHILLSEDRKGYIKRMLDDELA